MSLSGALIFVESVTNEYMSTLFVVNNTFNLILGYLGTGVLKVKRIFIP